MMQITSGAGTEEQALKFAKERMSGAGGSDVINKANLEFSHLPDPLQEWLKAPTFSGLELTMGHAKNELNSVWRTDVVARFSSSLLDRYPLSRKNPHDATMADFSSFFAPKGTIDKFFENNLKSFVDTSGPEWRQASVDNQSLRLSPETLNQFRYAAKIRDAFFPNGEANPSVHFQLRPLSLDSNAASFRISIDGQTDEYSHGPALYSSFQWPGPHPNMGVVISFMTLENNMVSQVEEGPWALFKALDKATVESTSLKDVYNVTFQVGGLKARYELRAGSVFNPFNLPELQKFHCPESL
jgi:type VI secretion system protein ImpL